MIRRALLIACVLAPPDHRNRPSEVVEVEPTKKPNLFDKEANKGPTIRVRDISKISAPSTCSSTSARTSSLPTRR